MFLEISFPPWDKASPVPKSVPVDRLKFVGNQLFTAQQLHRALQDQLGVLTVMGKDEIQNTIHEFYSASGYIQLYTRWLPNNVLHIREEKPFRIGKLEIQQATLFPTEYLLSLLELKPGDIADFSKIRNGLEKIRQLYVSAGRFDWHYEPSQVIRTEEGEVDIIFKFFDKFK